MAGQIFLFLAGIPGESTAVNFKDWIGVTSFSIGNSMEVDAEAKSGSAGGNSGAADAEDLSVDKKMDWATPKLLACCADGSSIGQARLVQCNTVNNEVTVVSDYALSSCIITSCSLSASGGAIPDESLTVNYGSVIWNYHCYDHQNASVHLGNHFTYWDIINESVKEPAVACMDIYQGIPTAAGSVPGMDYSACFGASAGSLFPALDVSGQNG